jgi:hypothetical protein
MLLLPRSPLKAYNEGAVTFRSVQPVRLDTKTEFIRVMQ